MIVRVQILVRGIVQGVGFRPFVYAVATRESLRGTVFNTGGGVLVDVEGDGDSIEKLLSEIELNPPPLSRVESVRRSDGLPLAHYRDFRIIESSRDGEQSVAVSPDVATCADCLRELFDPADRRHRYPFINCTNCGPRFTIVESVPYDRARTTMRDFVMCAACRDEYRNPRDRRFHAEPTACTACGPRLTLKDVREITQGESREDDGGRSDDAVARARALLSDGMVVAVKGIGGFHLACDALDADAVGRLRQRKYREDKPFALMANSLEVVKKFCAVSDEEAALLSSAGRPVVLLERKSGAALPAAVAPRVGTLGFMLPYSPLHHLLVENSDRPLVLTSGNVSDEPVCYENEDAAERLRAVADYFLTHDRRIETRADDSVARVFAGREMLLRRSRGYAPAPLGVGFEFTREILACGAELKNTFCLARDSSAFVSHHIGDLENLETLRAYEHGIEHFKRLFHLRPEVVAYDLHPEYLSTKYALALDDIQTKIGVQHHHAHVASCMADNGIDGEVIGVAMDGLGFGADGALWGGEFFVANFKDAERVAHLDYVPLPGGARAVREPWRMAAVYLQRAFGDKFLELDLPSVRNLDARSWSAMRRMIETNTNSPRTSSVGRLFDAVAGILSLRGVANYEGQAAIELEALAERDCARGYEFELDGDGSTINADPVIRRAVEDVLEGAPAGIVSGKFHLGVAHLIASVSRKVRDERKLDRVALSGGVFQNVLLLRHACRLLKADGFEVFTHSRVPANDGGISLGQSAVANARIVSGRI
ncbi:MAG: carbamoyltransferase HypF [Acidobacteria bacterium]|nr:carbamoyltransferase HypF [Acidobacteriota bacterium]